VRDKIYVVGTEYHTIGHSAFIFFSISLCSALFFRAIASLLPIVFFLAASMNDPGGGEGAEEDGWEVMPLRLFFPPPPSEAEDLDHWQRAMYAGQAPQTVVERLGALARRLLHVYNTI
jgi:hypothetical protein